MTSTSTDTIGSDSNRGAAHKVRAALRWTALTVLGTLIQIGFDRALLADSREISGSSSTAVSIDRPGGMTDIVLFYVFAAVVATVLSWSYSRYIRRSQRADPVEPMRDRRWQAPVAVWAGTVLVALSIGRIALVPTVDPRAEISGTAGNVEWFHYLLVAPLGSGDCWLQSPIPLMITQGGRWTTRAYFQGRRGDAYLILAVAAPQRMHPRVLDRPGRYRCEDVSGLAGNRFARIVQIK